VEPVLDETSLVPCAVWLPATRISHLAGTLRALDRLGVPRVLRSVRDASDRNIFGGYGLRFWCFQRDVDKDVGRFVAQRLGRQPYIDGLDGLFAAAEGNRVIEARADGVIVIGIGLAALEDGVAVAVGSAAHSEGHVQRVELLEYDGDQEQNSVVEVPLFIVPSDVQIRKVDIVSALDRSVGNGAILVQRLPELFPRLALGPRARRQVEALLGSEAVFRQLLRHLRALNRAASEWIPGRPFLPVGVTYSDESNETLQHGRYGPMRDFPSPNGYAARRWSSHTKLTGGSGARVYFSVEHANATATVLVGYVGDHLPSVSFPG
jgi:hypothetical protein